MTETYYVVMECGWEYNDQYMYRPECGGGNPVKVFTSLRDAKEFARHLTLKNFKFFRDDRWASLSEYITEGEGVESLFNEEGVKLLREAGAITTEDEWYVELDLKKLVDAQLQKLATCLQDPHYFYEVVEIEK